MKIPIRTSILLIGINGILAFDFLIENGQTTFASNVEVKDFQFVTNFDITGTTLDKLVTTCTNILLKKFNQLQLTKQIHYCILGWLDS